MSDNVEQQKNLALVGNSITWVYTTYPTYENGDPTIAYVNNLYKTGTIVRATKALIFIEYTDDDGSIRRFKYTKQRLLECLEDPTMCTLIEQSIPEEREPRHQSTDYAVYTLSDPRNGTVNYVGISKNMLRRYKQHCQCQGMNLELNLWIQDLLRQGLVPTFAVIESVTGVDIAQERESYWIQHYTAENAPLKNIAKAERDGGTRIDDPIIEAMVQAGLLEGYHG